MTWLQLSLTTDEDKSALVQLLFESMDALSVTFGDAADQPLLEPKPGATPMWNLTRVTALFEADRDPNELRNSVYETLDETIAKTLEIERLEDREWERAWLDAFHPMRFGKHLWICPDRQLPEDSEAVIVELDPGLAFGTGTHPTTALCLDWLGSHDIRDKTVVDYGCGSGILGVAALRLGAASVTAVDYDPQALTATIDNADKNRVHEKLSTSTPKDCPQIDADIVLANILAGTLIELEPDLARLTKPGGAIILSGILQEQAGQVSKAYEHEFDMQKPIVREDWILLEGQRKS